MKPKVSQFQRKKGEYYCEDIALSDLAREFGTPLYVYSANQIRQNILNFTQTVKSDPVHFHFAVKANSNSHILKIIRDSGMGLDLVTYGEWWLSKRAGFSAADCIWSGLLKPASELQQVLSSTDGGVHAVHVESVEELDAVMAAANAVRRPVRVGFRFRPSVDAKTHTKISTGRKGDKFGMSESEILECAERLRGHPLLELTTLSIHIGSQILKVDPYVRAFKKLQKLREKVEKILGRPLGVLDLGGGFGISYDGKSGLDFKKVYSSARKTFGKKIYLSFEPGRSVIANASVLLAQTVFRKKVDGRNLVIVDAAMNDMMRPAMYDAFHRIETVIENSAQRKLKWDVVGGVCESSDIFGKDRPLALQGESPLLMVRDVGAYGYSMANQYNARPRPAEVLVDGSQVQLIRRRENLEDLVRLES